MILKFILWAAGAIIVSLLIVTGYGVITGALPWKDYIAVWTLIIGIVLGWIGKAIEGKS